MSKRHQASRRRSYGRRQHELHERTEREDAIGWLGGPDLDGSPADWGSGPGRRAEAAWLGRVSLPGLAFRGPSLSVD